MTAAPTQAAASAAPVSLVTQTRVAPEHDEQFARWQEQVNAALAQFPGFLDHNVIPPSPPAQVDWVIVQRFNNAGSARAWLQSQERLKLLDAIQPVLVGQDDIHLLTDSAADRPPAPVTAVISMRVQPGQEGAFLRWQRRIAAVEAEFPGFSGYKLEPPVPGVQDDWVTILRIDSDAHLDGWLNSEQRQRFIAEAADFSVASHMRKVRSGFDAWFTTGDRAGTAPPPAWKINMIVLLMLYPTVFLFGYWVQNPLLVARGVPFWLALFISNAVSTVLLGYWLVPQASRPFEWWLRPGASAPRWVNWAGVGLVVLLYGVCLAVFANFP